MSCDKFEHLLPLYIEAELCDADRQRLEEHLTACASCRESLGFYRELESSLVSLRAVRPSPARTALAVSERLGLRPRPKPVIGWASAPVGISAVFIILGVVLFAFRDAVAEFFVRFGQTFSLGYARVVAYYIQDVDRVGLAGEWVLVAVYIGISALILLTGSWMVLKFVRE